MIRPVHIALALSLLPIQDAAWVPDPHTNGLTQVYVPEGSNCTELNSSNAMLCWRPGEEVAALRHIHSGATVEPLGGPVVFTAPTKPFAAHAMPVASRIGMESARRDLRAALRHADAAQKTGDRQEMIEAIQALDIAREKIQTAEGKAQ